MRKRRPGPDRDPAAARPETADVAEVPAVTATDTGEATARDGGTALTGYRGPGPGTGGSIQVTHTGSASAAEGSIANTGYLAVDNITFVQQAAPQAPAEWPHQVGRIPPRALSFQHRAEVDQLRAVVDGGGAAVLCQVLSGTGGVGKTQLAANYARTAWDAGEVDVLVWITARSPEEIETGYGWAGVELLGADPGDLKQAARAFLAWLEPKADQKPCRWLVILDDLANPADLRGLWPPASHGRTLVTTRRREASLTGQGRHEVTVGLFTPGEAAAYLAAVLAAHNRTEPADQIDGLATELGYLPLALSQAAAYLIDAALTCAAYRRLLADRIKKLADLLPEPGDLPDEQATTLAATWDLSIERADQIRPAGLARPMLQITAMLDPNGIPHTILTSEPALNHLAAHRTPGERQPLPVTSEDAVGALRALHRLSLIDHTPDIPCQAVRVHQLIQRATLDALTRDQRDALACTAAEALTAVWPDVERDTVLVQTLRANTDALTRQAEDALYWPSGTRSALYRTGQRPGESRQAASYSESELGHGCHRVLFRAGRSLGEAGLVAEAAAYFQNLCERSARWLGVDHPAALAACANFASYRGRAGDVAGAVKTLEELLSRTQQILGSDHPDTLNTRARLAAWRGRAGRLVEAITALEELHADQLRILGPDHVNALATRASIASLRSRAGDLSGAAVVLGDLLKDQLRLLGPDHPDTLATRGSIAALRRRVGDLAGAASEFEEVLVDQERVLGQNHPNIFSTRASLAAILDRNGDAAGAMRAFEELLADRQRVLGPNHPDTFATRESAAGYRGRSGDIEGAVTALEELLADRKRVLGPEHPDTLRTRARLASWRRHTTDRMHPGEALQELLEDQLRVLGPDHPDTLDTLSRLRPFRKPEQIAEAGAFMEELLADQLQRLGPEYPETLATRAKVASWRGRCRHPADAAQALDQLLADQRRILGDDHPETFATWASLAAWQHEAGDHTRAAGTLRRLIAAQRQIIGLDHPQVVAALTDLATYQRDAGDYPGAAEALRRLAASQARALGPDHRDTLATRARYASALGRAGDPARAVKDLLRIGADQRRILGPDHPDILDTLARLAHWSREAGYKRSVEDLQELLSEQRRILGPNASETLNTMNKLALWYKLDGRYKLAMEVLRKLLKAQQQILGSDHPDTLATRARISRRSSRRRGEPATPADSRRRLNIF